MSECRDCKNYIGNCGHHFRDWKTEHINFEIPNEGMFDGVIGNTPRCFEPSEEYKEMCDLNKAAEIASSYSIEVIKKALEMKERMK